MTATRSSSAAPAAFGALRHRQFRSVWAASVVSQGGSWFMITGRAFLVYELTQSSAALGIIYFFSLIPMLLFSQIGGALADRLDRRRMLINCQLSMTVSSLMIGVITQAGLANMVLLCALAFAYGVGQALAMPAQQALIPALVPREALTSAISLQSIANSGSRIVGPLLAGMLLPVVGAPWLFYLNSITFVFVIATWMSIRVPSTPASATPRTGSASFEALAYVRQRPNLLLPLAAAAIVGGIGLSYSPQMASFASIYLADGDVESASRYYGFLQMAIGVGSVVGVILLPKVGHRHPAGALLVGVAGFGVGLTLLGLVPSPFVSLIACVVLGSMQFATGAHVLSLLQHNVAEELRGRVISLYQVAFVGLFPILGLASGALASTFGVAEVFAATGLICAISAVPIAGRRSGITLAAHGG